MWRTDVALAMSFIVPFSREYREMEANTELLERLFTPDPAAAGSLPRGSG